MEIDWIKQKESVEGTLKNLQITLVTILIQLYKNGFEIKPNLWLGTLEQIFEHRKKGFIPAIAERKDNDIVFYYDIIKEFIDEVNDEDEIAKFMESVCLHEVSHILLNHKSDTEENRHNAESQTNLWMTIYCSEHQKIFLKRMPLVDKICEKNKKK